MREKCPFCGYDFIDYIKRDIETDDCPACRRDIRIADLAEHQITCTHCHANLVAFAYEQKQKGIEVEECPFCFTPLLTKDGKSKDGCPTCGHGMDSVIIDGIVNFQVLGQRNGGSCSFSNSRGNDLNVHVKCSHCNSILDYVLPDYPMIRARLLSLFRIGDY